MRIQKSLSQSIQGKLAAHMVIHSEGLHSIILKFLHRVVTQYSISYAQNDDYLRKSYTMLNIRSQSKSRITKLKNQYDMPVIHYILYNSSKHLPYDPAIPLLDITQEK